MAQRLVNYLLYDRLVCEKRLRVVHSQPDESFKTSARINLS